MLYFTKISMVFMKEIPTLFRIYIVIVIRGWQFTVV